MARLNPCMTNCCNCPLSLLPTHTAFIFAVGEVDPQSSGRQERQRDRQTTAAPQTAKKQQLITFTLMGWAQRGNWKGSNFKATDSSDNCGTSFCLFSSFCQLAVGALTPGSLFGSHCRLLLPVAHIDTHRHPCPQGDPSCERTIKRRGIGDNQNPRARFQGATCNDLSGTMKSNQTERGAGRRCVHACGGGVGWGGSCFRFHSSHQVSAPAVGTLSQLGHSRITVAGRIQTKGDGGVTAKVSYLWHQTTVTSFRVCTMLIKLTLNGIR